jgi:uncharacterized membrane protein YfcA
VTFATAALLFLAAAIGGGLNSVAGGGSFVAFPALLFAGVPPVAANATNTIAMWPSGVASAVAYRRELRDVGHEIVPLGIAALLGGLGGSVLLLSTPETTFVKLIPWLLLFATVLFTFGTPLARRLSANLHDLDGARGGRAPLTLAVVAQLAISVYGGYFGGGMGIMMLAVFTLLGMTHIHRMNALKNALGVLINGVAVVAFIVAGAVRWAPGAIMIVGGMGGGYLGAAMARRVDPKRVRRLVVIVAWGMTAYFFVRTYAHLPT